LGAGPTVLLTYLRSYCFLNEETGEIRDQVTITRPQLADALGIDRTTLFRWLKKIDKTRRPTSPSIRFWNCSTRKKRPITKLSLPIGFNSMSRSLAKHLALYREKVQAYQLAAVQNETHTQGKMRPKSGQRCKMRRTPMAASGQQPCKMRLTQR
jgi:hypothetical protein